MIGRHHFYGRYILLFFQQLTEVRVGGASFELRLGALLRVVGFHHLLADIAAARHMVQAFSPRRVVDQPPDYVSELVFFPFQVIDPVLLHIAHCDDLDVRAGEYSADFPYRLGSEADAGQSNLLAGRDNSGPA